jgi:hypothetical protein
LGSASPRVPALLFALEDFKQPRSDLALIRSRVRARPAAAPSQSRCGVVRDAVLVVLADRESEAKTIDVHAAVSELLDEVVQEALHREEPIDERTRSKSGDVGDHSGTGELIALVQHDPEGDVVFETLLVKMREHCPPQATHPGLPIADRDPAEASQPVGNWLGRFAGAPRNRVDVRLADVKRQWTAGDPPCSRRQRRDLRQAARDRAAAPGGRDVNHKRVERLMRAEGIQGAYVASKRRRSGDGLLGVDSMRAWPDLPERDFSPAAPNQV